MGRSRAQATLRRAEPEGLSLLPDKESPGSHSSINLFPPFLHSLLVQVLRVDIFTAPPPSPPNRLNGGNYPIAQGKAMVRFRPLSQPTWLCSLLLHATPSGLPCPNAAGTAVPLSWEAPDAGVGQATGRAEPCLSCMCPLPDAPHWCQATQDAIRLITADPGCWSDLGCQPPLDFGLVPSIIPASWTSLLLPRWGQGHPDIFLLGRRQLFIWPPHHRFLDGNGLVPGLHL